MTGTSLFAILRLPFCCLEHLSIILFQGGWIWSLWDWDSFTSELKDALSNIICSAILTKPFPSHASPKCRVPSSSTMLPYDIGVAFPLAKWFWWRENSLADTDSFEGSLSNGFLHTGVFRPCINPHISYSYTRTPGVQHLFSWWNY